MKAEVKTTTDTLTARLHAQADAKLEKELTEKMESLFKMFNDRRSDDKDGYFDDEDRENVWIGEPWRKLDTAMRKVLTPLYREQEVRDFIEKVERLSTDVQALQSSVENI